MKFTQATWEIYFVASIVFILTCIFMCTLEGSRSIIELPYITIVAGVNLVYAIYIGNKPQDDCADE